LPQRWVKYSFKVLFEYKIQNILKQNLRYYLKYILGNVFAVQNTKFRELFVLYQNKVQA